MVAILSRSQCVKIAGCCLFGIKSLSKSLQAGHLLQKQANKCNYDEKQIQIWSVWILHSQFFSPPYRDCKWDPIALRSLLHWPIAWQLVRNTPIWTNAGNCIKVQFSHKKFNLKMSSTKMAAILSRRQCIHFLEKEFCSLIKSLPKFVPKMQVTISQHRFM